MEKGATNIQHWIIKTKQNKQAPGSGVAVPGTQEADVGGLWSPRVSDQPRQHGDFILKTKPNLNLLQL